MSREIFAGRESFSDMAKSLLTLARKKKHALSYPVELLSVVQTETYMHPHPRGPDEALSVPIFPSGNKNLEIEL